MPVLGRKRPRQQQRTTIRSLRPALGLGAIAVVVVASLCVVSVRSLELPTNNVPTNNVVNAADDADGKDYGNHNLEWEDGPSSWEEFGHDNSPDVCGLPVITVEEWEAGRYWEKNKPVIVKNVTDGWAALQNWKKQKIVELYPDAEATMGEGKKVGEVGPDDAGSWLELTNLKDFITKHMYHPLRYFFDRKIAIPQGMLNDCKPFPEPTRTFLENPDKWSISAPAKKAKVRNVPDRELWRDHLAVSIGSDLQGLTFHHHREAWNIVIFGKKRWILWDRNRWKDNGEMQWRLTRDWENNQHVSSAEWLRRLYPQPNRTFEIRNYGHDCIQHEGEMMFVPFRWMHMVMNIGDTVAVISEVGLGIGEGKKPQDFLSSPDDWSSDDEESSDDSRDRIGYRGRGYSEDDSGDGFPHFPRIRPPGPGQRFYEEADRPKYPVPGFGQSTRAARV